MYCIHLDRELVSERECVTCADGPVSLHPDPLLLVEQYAARMVSDEGYWSMEREVKRSTQHYVPCKSCHKRRMRPRQDRMCSWCNEQIMDLHLKELDTWSATLEPTDLAEHAFEIAIASDRSARLHDSHFVGLYPDDPPLAGRVPTA